MPARWREHRPLPTVGRVKPPRIARALLCCAVAAAACASGPKPPHCKIEVVGLEEYREDDRGVDIAYRVRGDAGAEGSVWLAAKTREGKWISGLPLDVGPGEFGAIVDLELTGRAAEYKTVLQIDGRRCADDAPEPRG